MFQKARSNNGALRCPPGRSLLMKREDGKRIVVCEHRFCSQTKTIGDRNCTACFSLANIFNQSTNKSFGAKLQSEVYHEIRHNSAVTRHNQLEFWNRKAKQISHSSLQILLLRLIFLVPDPLL